VHKYIPTSLYLRLNLKEKHLIDFL
jgi:hypothetical protein